MAKAKISSQDFLNLLDEQNDQPSPVLGSRQQSLASSPSKTDSEKETIGKQLVSKREAVGNLIGKQLVSKREAVGNLIGKQLVSSEPVVGESEKAHWEAIGKLIGKQVEDPLVSRLVSKNSVRDEASLDRLTRLVGVEAKMISCVLESCLARGQLLSNPLSPEFLARACGTTKKTIKTTGQRLIKKGLLARSDSKRGNGGWTIFAVSESTRNAFLEMGRIGSIGKQLVSKTQCAMVSKKEADWEANASSSSSFLELENLKTTTTEPEPKKSDISPLSQDWMDLDYSPLTEIGFTQSHLSQIARQGNLSAAEVQDAIYFFAFDLKQNGKGKEIKGSAVNFFMGILRKGILYAPPENYESPAEIARREYLEGKRRLEARRQAEERELMDLEFSEWKRGLNASRIAEIVPEWARRPGPMQDSALKTHFENEVWPARRTSTAAVTQYEKTLGDITG